MLVSSFMSWNKRSQKCLKCTNVVHISNVQKLVYILVSQHFSFAKIIHCTDKCGISRSWLNSSIITKVHLVLGTIQSHSKRCRFVIQHNATDVSSLRKHSIGILTAGMSTRAVATELNFNFSTISSLHQRFREFGSTSNRPHNRRSRVTTPAQELHIRLLPLRDHLRPATRTPDETDETAQPRIFSTNCLWHSVGERFAVNVMNRVPHVGGGVMVWATNTIAFYQWQFECTEIAWRDPEAHHIMFQHDNGQPHVPLSHNSWKLQMS